VEGGWSTNEKTIQEQMYSFTQHGDADTLSGDTGQERQTSFDPTDTVVGSPLDEDLTPPTCMSGIVNVSSFLPSISAVIEAAGNPFRPGTTLVPVPTMSCKERDGGDE
jgi:hypothetical protein